MSNRENQGIQIALILFVIITVVLCVFTYFFYSQSETRGKELAQVQQQLDTMRTSHALLDSKVQHLRFFIGMKDTDRTSLEDANLPTDDDLDAIKAKYEKDMEVYGQGLPDDNKNYSSLPENLIAAIRQKNSGLTDANNRVKTAVDTRDRTVTDEAQKTALANTAHKKAADDLVAVNSGFTIERARYTTETAAQAKTIADQSKLLVSTRETSKAREEELNKDVEKLTTLAEAFQAEKRKLSNKDFEIPDGKISWVNQRANVVWINLGSADMLRPQTTFSVYDHNANGVANKNSKARIEVTKIVGAHQAECRILEDELANPILKSDLIHTPAWQPGRKLRFAMAGILDVDGDDRSDPSTVRRVVTMNGGQVDLELKPDGSVDGKMSVNTRYLVLGEPPIGADGKVDADMMTTYASVIKDANQLGVSTISLDQFLNFMGWRVGSQTVPLGKRLGGTSPGSYLEGETPADAFKNAPKRGDDGAF